MKNLLFKLIVFTLIILFGLESCTTIASDEDIKPVSISGIKSNEVSDDYKQLTLIPESNDILLVQHWYTKEIENIERKGKKTAFAPIWNNKASVIQSKNGKVLLIPVYLKNTSISEIGHYHFWYRLAIFFDKKNQIIDGKIIFAVSTINKLSIEKIVLGFVDDKFISDFSGFINIMSLDKTEQGSYRFDYGSISTKKVLIKKGSDFKENTSATRIEAITCNAYYEVTTYEDGSKTWEYLYTLCDSTEDTDPGNTGGGGNSEPPPPIPIDTILTPGLYSKQKECTTFKKMWNSSLATNPDGSQYPLIEQAALLTDKGLLVMPTSGKRAISHNNNGVVSFTPDGDEVENTEQSSHLDLLGGFYLNSNNKLSYKTYDGTVYLVLGYIHTHPATSYGNPQLPSTGDKNDNYISLYGIHAYILGAEGIIEYNNQGSLGIKFSFSQLMGCNSFLF